MLRRFGLLVIGLLIVGPVPVFAQESTAPRVRIEPVGTDCRVTPRPLASVLAAILDGVSSDVDGANKDLANRSPAFVPDSGLLVQATDAILPVRTGLVASDFFSGARSVNSDEPAAASPQHPVPIGAVSEVIQQYFACVNAGDFPRAFALVTDARLRQILGAWMDDLSPGQIAAILTAPPVATSDPIASIEIDDVRILPNGKAEAEFRLDDAFFPFSYVVTSEAGRYLIDDGTGPRGFGGTCGMTSCGLGVPDAPKLSGPERAPSTQATAAVLIVVGRPSEYAFDPAAITIPANTVVTTTVANAGTVPHNFTIEALAVSIDLAPGAVQTTTINASAGEYPFYCTEPGHRETGLDGALVAR
jgi:plastocyanin